MFVRVSDGIDHDIALSVAEVLVLLLDVNDEIPTFTNLDAVIPVSEVSVHRVIDTLLGVKVLLFLNSIKKCKCVFVFSLSYSFTDVSVFMLALAVFAWN